MRQASEPSGNAIDGDVHGNVVQARDIYVYGTRPRTVSAKRPLRPELLTVMARSMLAAGKPLEAGPIVVGPLAEDDTRIPDLVADIDPSAVPLLADTFTEIVDYLGHR